MDIIAKFANSGCLGECAPFGFATKGPQTNHAIMHNDGDVVTPSRLWARSFFLYLKSQCAAQLAGASDPVLALLTLSLGPS